MRTTLECHLQQTQQFLFSESRQPETWSAGSESLEYPRRPPQLDRAIAIANAFELAFHLLSVTK